MSVEHRPIIGMLITDTHQREFCLGQFRFDRKLERIQLNYSRLLRFAAARTNKSFLYVMDVWGEGPRPSSHDPNFLLSMPLEGTLVWRFSRHHTELYHSSLQGFWRPL
ncbi:hypothetical protein BDY21DRAFT_359722 [Lineolata rhizophorae]|uniref:Uncharacterized protein n=1 Tax=Lineolata rhizophorae TaxID=578093 RepID=A0A6A6NKR4_9PEZI|nr:hypothetical protein BDY21DRAFT_359722 [Lineolata rhizophorae]